MPVTHLSDVAGEGSHWDRLLLGSRTETNNDSMFERFGTAWVAQALRFKTHA